MSSWSRSLSSNFDCQAMILSRSVLWYAGWGKVKCPTRKSLNLRNARNFLHQILLISLAHYCAQIRCFVLSLLDVRQIDGNTTFKNESRNWTEGMARQALPRLHWQGLLAAKQPIKTRALTKSNVINHHYAPARREGGNKRCFCPSVAYIAKNSRTKRPSVPKFRLKIPHLRCD